MLHHASFNAHDPQAVAGILAEMTGATAIRAPSPPFPAGAWFVCYGDDAGSYLEVIPWGHVLDPEAPFSVGYDAAMPQRAGSHVLVGTPLPASRLQAIAEREGWRAEIVDARLFRVLKVWVENAILVEFLTPEMSALYRETFGPSGVATLDARLRELEAPAG